MNPGQILLLDWPNSDGTTRKYRPCVVVSSATYNLQGSDVIVAMISSNYDRNEREDIHLPDSDPGFAQTRLKLSSVIRCGKVYTFDRRQHHKLLGTVTPALLETIRQKLRAVIA